MPDAPDLSDLTPVVPRYAMRLGFVGHPAADWAARSYISNFIAVTDKAIAEYQAGRALLRFGDSGDLEDFLRFLLAPGHFETCLSSVRRALRYQTRIQNHPEGPDVERVVRRLLESHLRGIVHLRDGIEHMDEWISSGEVEEGNPVMLRIPPDGDSLAISSYRLRFRDLALLLRRLHDFSMTLASLRAR